MNIYHDRWEISKGYIVFLETTEHLSWQVDESGEIIHLETSCPWKRHLFDLTKKFSLPKYCVKFAIFKHDMWLVQVSVGVALRIVMPSVL